MTTFNPGGRFYGSAAVGTDESDFATVTLDFTVSHDPAPGPDGPSPITPLMVAEALNDLLTSNGWPAAQFYGTPVDEPLN